jgi:WD40 repeat protein
MDRRRAKHVCFSNNFLNASNNFNRYRYFKGHRDVKLAPSRLEGAATFSSINIVEKKSLQVDSQNVVENCVVLAFSSFVAAGYQLSQLSLKFQSDWASSGNESMNNLSLVQQPDEDPKSGSVSFTFNISDVLKKVICETSAFEHLSEWAVVSCPSILDAQSECCVIPSAVSSRYVVFNGKLYPLGYEAPKSQIPRSDKPTPSVTIPRDHHKTFHTLCSCQLKNIECSYGHKCVPRTDGEYGRRCDECEQDIPSGSEGLVCNECEYFICERCASSYLSTPSKLHLKACFDQCCFECKRAAPMFSYFCEKCSSCIPPQCVFVEENSYSEQEYPVCVSVKAGCIQRHRAVKFASFDTIPIGSEVMLIAPSEVFLPNEVLKVVAIQSTKHGPEFIVRLADDDLNECGFTRMEQLRSSSLQLVIDGTLNKHGVFVKDARFTMRHPRKQTPATYFDALVGTVTKDKESFFVEWPLADCLHQFRVSRVLDYALEASSENKSKQKYQSLLEKLSQLIEKRERFKDNQFLEFFDVLFVGNQCNVFEDPKILKKKSWESVPSFTIIRCGKADRVNTNFCKISQHEHQICSSIKTMMNGTDSTRKPKVTSSKVGTSISFGLRRKEDLQFRAESDFDITLDAIRQDFLCEKETPLRLKLKKPSNFAMVYVTLDNTEAKKKVNFVNSVDSVLQFSTSPMAVDIDAESKNFKDFDIYIDFCREIGGYFQVKRFVIQHRETKYAIGVIMECDGHWVEVHSGSFRETNNKILIGWDEKNSKLACFLQHPFSGIVAESKRQCLIFTVDAAQGKGNFVNKGEVQQVVEEWLRETQKKKMKFNVTEEVISNVTKEVTETKFCVSFSSVEDGNAFYSSARDGFFQIKEVTVGPQITDDTNTAMDEIEKSEKRLYFINLLEKEKSKLFSHRTELENEPSDVPRLEYPVLLPLPKSQITNGQNVEHTFKLQIAKSHRYMHPVVSDVPDSLEAGVHFIFYENYKKSGKSYGKWKYAHVISSSACRTDGHVMIEEIDDKNQRSHPRLLKLWLVECDNANCQNETNPYDDCLFFHLQSPSSGSQEFILNSPWLDDFCPNWKKCSNLNCALNHQKPKKVVSTVLSFRIVTDPLIFPSEKSTVFLKPNLHETSEYFLKGFLRPWLPGRVVGIDIGKQLYKVKPIVQKVPETECVSSSWANGANIFAAFCEQKIEVHDSTGKKFESSHQVLVRSYAWISYEHGKHTLAYGCEDGCIRLWPSPDSKNPETYVLKGHLGAITCICPITSADMSLSTMSNSLACFATGSADADIRLWQKIERRWHSQVGCDIT